MLLYTDIVTGDDMVTDAYKMELKDDAFYYVKGKLNQYKSDDVDDSVIGGNKSAEAVDDDGGTDTTTESKINIVHENRLVEVFFADKKDYVARHLKPFFGAIKKEKFAKKELDESDTDAVKAWEKHMNELVKKHILTNFKELQFFYGASMNEEGLVACVNYIDDEPVMIFFKDGLKEVKC